MFMRGALASGLLVDRGSLAEHHVGEEAAIYEEPTPRASQR